MACLRYSPVSLRSCRAVSAAGLLRDGQEYSRPFLPLGCAYPEEGPNAAVRGAGLGVVVGGGGTEYLPISQLANAKELELLPVGFLFLKYLFGQNFFAAKCSVAQLPIR